MQSMAKPVPIITMLTDFGEKDGYVGAMKGVILGIAPSARLVDITHQIGPQNILQAAILLDSIYRYYPPQTVHLVVVDPGVGSQRRPVAVATPRGYFVAPDNGVLSYILLQEPDAAAVALDNPDYWLPEPSYTFHGRDIFSPAAAHLANRVPLTALGSPLENLAKLEMEPLRIYSHAVQGRVIRVDRFGNVLTNIARLRWVDEDSVELAPLVAEPVPDVPLRFPAQSARITFSWHTLTGLRKTYSEAGVGQSLALIGSNGELEIAINQGDASAKLALSDGDPVTLRFDA
jgi:hypothetical protein